MFVNDQCHISQGHGGKLAIDHRYMRSQIFYRIFRGNTFEHRNSCAIFSRAHSPCTTTTKERKKQKVMKKCVLFAAAAIGITMLGTGCVNNLGMANGYGFAPPALVYSGTTFGSYTEQNIEALKRPYEILGTVTGEAETTNILLIASFGDGSIVAAEKDALSKIKGADAIINRTFYTKHNSVLCIFTAVTNCVTGTAIRYTDSK